MPTFTCGHSQQTVPNQYGAVLRSFLVSKRSKQEYVASCGWLKATGKVLHTGGSRLLAMSSSNSGHGFNQQKAKGDEGEWTAWLSLGSRPKNICMFGSIMLGLYSMALLSSSCWGRFLLVRWLFGGSNCRVIYKRWRWTNLSLVHVKRKLCRRCVFLC